MDAPVSRYTGNHSAIQRAALATMNQTNRAAWIAIHKILVEAGVPPHDAWTQARVAAWAARKRLRRRRRRL